jgi:hypothetical protein
MKSAERALNSIEVARRRVANERRIAETTLANLYQRLGRSDADVLALDRVLTDWHSMLVKSADGMSELARKLAELQSDDAEG